MKSAEAQRLALETERHQEMLELIYATFLIEDDMRREEEAAMLRWTYLRYRLQIPIDAWDILTSNVSDPARMPAKKLKK